MLATKMGLGFGPFMREFRAPSNNANPKRRRRGIFIETLAPTNHQPRRGGII